VPIVNGWFRRKSNGLVYVLTVQRGVESEPSLDAEHTSVSCIMRREIGPEDSWHDGCM